MIPEVRFGGLDDLSQLQDLEREARAGLVGARGGDRWLDDHPMLGDAWTELLAAGWVLVGVIDGVVVGFLIMRVEGVRASVVAVYVTPQARECGFGDALLEAAIERFRVLKAETLDAEALPGDRHTKNLYERAGIKARLITVSVELSVELGGDQPPG